MLVIIIGRAAYFILALVMMRVATTLLSPAEMGRVSLILTTVAFFAMFLVNPVGMFINRRLHAWQESGFARYYLRRFCYYLLAVALFAALFLAVVVNCRIIGFGLSLGWLVILVCGTLFFNTINQTAIPSLNLLGDSLGYVVLSVVTIIASFLCGTVLVKMIEPAAQFWVLGLLLGQIIIGLLGAALLFRRLARHEPPGIATGLTISKYHWQRLFYFAYPVFIAAGLSWVQGQGYRYIMEAQLGLSQLGLFVAGYGISAGMIAGFESVLTTYFQPRLYKQASSDQPHLQAQAWRQYAASVTPSLLLTIAFIVMLAPYLTRIFLGENFQAASHYVVWGALAEAARVLVGVYTMIAHVFMKTNWLIIPSMVGAVLAIGLTLLFLPLWGAVGVGVSLVSAGAVTVLIMHLLLIRHVGRGVPLRALLTAAGYGLVMLLATLGLGPLFPGGQWYGVVVIVGAVGVLYLGGQYMLLRPHLLSEEGE